MKDDCLQGRYGITPTEIFAYQHQYERLIARSRERQSAFNKVMESMWGDYLARVRQHRKGAMG